MIAVRLPKREHDFIRALAEERGVTMSDLVREALRGEIRAAVPRGPAGPPPSKRRRRK